LTFFEKRLFVASISPRQSVAPAQLGDYARSNGRQDSCDGQRREQDGNV
jgi:hypothetical protein